MDNADNFIMVKEVKGHQFMMLVYNELGFWQGVTNCVGCNMHYHFDTLDFLNPDSMIFIEGELAMHAAGVNEGWSDGQGFVAEDVDTDDTI